MELKKQFNNNYPKKKQNLLIDSEHNKVKVFKKSHNKIKIKMKSQCRINNKRKIKNKRTTESKWKNNLINVETIIFKIKIS